MKALKILIPTDFSQNITLTLAQVARIFPKELPIDYYFLHVLDLSASATLYDPSMTYLGAFEEQLLKASETKLGELTAELKHQGLHASVHLRKGYVEDEITRFAQDNTVDLIAMPSHSRSGLSRLVMGSVTERLARLALSCITPENARRGMSYVLSSHEMKGVDHYALSTASIPSVALMETAGLAVASYILKRWGSRLLQNKRDVVILCGPGNNGGDGWVVSRYLILKGVRVHSFLAADPKDLSAESRTHLEILQKMGHHTHPLRHASDPSLEQALKTCSLLVDALFGVGLSRPLESPHKDIVAVVNRWRSHTSSARVVSVDIPSGLDATRGLVLGSAIRADVSLNLGYRKLGCCLNQGPDQSGKVRVIPLSYSDAWVSQLFPQAIRELTPDVCEQPLQERGQSLSQTSFKQSFGHAAVVAGSPEFSGAAILASQAAMRVGAGLTTIMTPSSAHALIKKHLIEVMSHPLTDSHHEGIVTRQHLPDIHQILAKKNALLIGPGLKDHPDLKPTLVALIEQHDLPTVLDAQALTTLGPSVCELPQHIQQRLILTPHPGEMATLLGVTSQQVQADRVGALKDLLSSFHGTVVLKGAYTLIGKHTRGIWLSPFACQALATAGTGDILAGMIVGLLAQQIDPLQSALSSVWFHAKAGMRFQTTFKGRGMIASDLLREPLIQFSNTPKA